MREQVKQSTPDTRKPAEKRKVQFETTNRSGGFSCLRDEDDKEKTFVLPKKEDFPALAAVAPTIKPIVSGYATALAKLPVLHCGEPTYNAPMSNFRIIQKGDRMKKTEIEKAYVRSNWATHYSSDEGSDDDEAAPVYKKKKSKNDFGWAEDHAEFAGVSVGGWGAYDDEL